MKGTFQGLLYPFLSYFMDTLLLYMAAFCAPAFSVSYFWGKVKTSA